MCTEQFLSGHLLVMILLSLSLKNDYYFPILPIKDSHPNDFRHNREGVQGGQQGRGWMRLDVLRKRIQQNQNKVMISQWILNPKFICLFSGLRSAVSVNFIGVATLNVKLVQNL